MADDLRLTALTATVEGDEIVLRLELANDSDRTLHAYRDARQIHFDEATATVTVGLTDRPAGPPRTGGMFVLPAFVAVDPHGTATLEVRLPRVITRLAGATPEGAPRIERVALDAATHVEVRIGWSDTPFYPDPRSGRAAAAAATHPRAQLHEWERGVRVGRAPLAKPDATGSR